MNYAVELYFDSESSEKIQKIRDAFIIDNISIDMGTKPHITLAIYSNIELKRLIKKIKEFSKIKIDLSFQLSNIGIFPTRESVIFLSPKVTQEILSFHKNFLSFMDEFNENLYAYYCEKLWVPHCTLGLNLNDEELINAVKVLRANFNIPIVGYIKQIGILEFPPNKQIYVEDCG